MRLLIVEDEHLTAEYLKKGLAENGYTVDLAATGDDGLALALSASYDLLILDVNLPGRDGWEILRELRKNGSDVPVLYLSARAMVEDKVKGLGLGADDYLVKPFAFTELLARLRTIARRGRARLPTLLEVADLRLDLLGQNAARDRKRLDLSHKDFALLSLLMRRQGEVLSRAVLLEQVWDAGYDVETNVVEVAIRRLREKVDRPFKKKLIHTVRGSGYVLKEAGEKR
jgi:two-component system copper resistance phosphate regulon response regulator CusR